MGPKGVSWPKKKLFKHIKGEVTMSVNKVMVLGHLGRDPELKYIPSGMAVCKFSVATNEYWTDKSGQKQERTEWHRIVVWDKQAERCSQYLAKGKQVFIEGRLQTSSWEGQDGTKRYSTEIVARVVQFIGGVSDVSSANGAKYTAGPQENAEVQAQAPEIPKAPPKDYQVGTDANFTADDIPF